MGAGGYKEEHGAGMWDQPQGASWKLPEVSTLYLLSGTQPDPASLCLS